MPQACPGSGSNNYPCQVDADPPGTLADANLVPMQFTYALIVWWVRQLVRCNRSQSG